MGIFSSIKDAIFGPDEVPVTPRSAEPAEAAPGTARPAAPSAPAAEKRPAPVIDVANHLDSMPGADRLNWRTSIVDLMKLIGVDSDYDSRAALAQELGRPEYSGTAEDNRWLHKRVMRELSASGGKVPGEFLD